jgi:hypothetical protein
MYTQHDTAQLILGRGADYVMTVKANTPTLYEQLRKLPWTRIPSVSPVGKDHGRRARRTVKVALAPAWTYLASHLSMIAQSSRIMRMSAISPCRQDSCVSVICPEI